MPSISRRVHKTFFAFSISIILIMLVLIMVASEDLEATMQHSELEEEIRFMQVQQAPDKPLYWKTANLIALYLPDNGSTQFEIPPLFTTLTVPFHGEVRLKDQIFLVHTAHHQNGRYFIAKNISGFEKREELFHWILAIAALVILVFTYFFAKIGGKRLTQPLDDLSHRIQTISVSAHMPRLDLNYQDQELLAITQTFNTFLDELESFVTREQSLMSLASHELRTPVAVISGAIEILHRRGQLSADDLKTLARIQNACAEMSANVDMLLMLSRRSESLAPHESLQVDAILDTVLEDLATRFDVFERVHVIKDAAVFHEGDRILVKMLLLNVIQNALQHTSAPIVIRLDTQKIEILDQGGGLPASIQDRLNQDSHALKSPQLPGLGLYIVTLICERLKWRLALENAEQQGTRVCIYFNK